jgi:hypothetical protein
MKLWKSNKARNQKNIIDPSANSECILNVELVIAYGTYIIVKEGKTMKISGSLIFQ